MTAILHPSLAETAVSSSALLTAVYARQSKAKKTSTDEQQELGEERAGTEGWGLGGVYRDGSSASPFAVKPRGGWARLLADLDEGRFHILWLWECSRGDRTLSSWATLLETCQRRGVRIYVENDGRLYDPRVATDWKVLASAGVDAEFESRKTSGRIGRHTVAHAKAGKPYGKCPFGYRREYEIVVEDGTPRRIIHQLEDPATARIVRDIIDRIAKAEPVITIVRDLNARDVPSPSPGKPWHRNSLRKIATNPAYIGKRSHLGTLYDADWPAIVDPKAFDAAARVLGDPARKTTRPGRARYLLSYAMTCGVCGGWVQGRPNRKSFNLVCSDNACASINGPWADQYVRLTILRWLAQPKVRSYLDATDDSDVLAARAEADALDREIAEYRALAKARKITGASFADIEADLVTQKKAAEKRATDAATPPSLRELLERAEAAQQTDDPAAAIAAFWDKELPLAALPEVVMQLL